MTNVRGEDELFWELHQASEKNLLKQLAGEFLPQIQYILTAQLDRRGKEAHINSHFLSVVLCRVSWTTFRQKPDYCVWVTSQPPPEHILSATDCIAAKCVAPEGNVKWNPQSLSDTRVGETCRHFDCLSYCLTLTLFCFTHSERERERESSSVISAVLWSHAVAWLSQPQCWACWLGEKACIGQILFRQIKKSMSSCLHQSTHCLSDGPTRYTTALLYLCLSLSLYPSSITSSSGCVTFPVSTLLFFLSSLFLLPFPCKTII